MLPLIIGGAALGGAVLTQAGRLAYNAAQKRREPSKPVRERAAEETKGVVIDAAVDVLDIGYARDREIAMLGEKSEQKWLRVVAKRVLQQRKLSAQRVVSLADAHARALVHRVSLSEQGVTWDDVIAVKKGEASSDVLLRWGVLESTAFGWCNAGRVRLRAEVRGVRHPEEPVAEPLADDLEVLCLHAERAWSADPDAAIACLFNDMLPDGRLGQSRRELREYVERVMQGQDGHGAREEHLATLYRWPEWSAALRDALMQVRPREASAAPAPAPVTPSPRPERDPLRRAIQARIADLSEFLADSEGAPEAFKRNARKEIETLQHAYDTGAPLTMAQQLKLQLSQTPSLHTLNFQEN